jgi:predicted nucleic acid-binding protein
MKPSLYLETTIPSYLTAWPSRDLIVAGHQQLTKEWWRRRRKDFEVCISQFVLDEAEGGDAEAAQERLQVLAGLPVLEVTDRVTEIASALLEAEIIPQKAATDAAHIAVSAVHNIDYLMTWNCAHIANAAILNAVRGICMEHGAQCPIICTPEELMEG